MFKVLIIDDEKDARSVLKDLLEMFCPQVSIMVEAKNGEEALQIASLEQFDIAFIDIQLRRMSGIELAQRLFKYCPNLIFVTAHDSYAVEAYQTEAIHYLLKPVNPHQLQQAVSRASRIRAIDKPEERLLLTTKYGVVLLEYDEIIRIHGDGNYCTVYSQDTKQYHVSKHLAYYEELLNSKKFFRVHQSHLINMSYVRQFLVDNGYFVILKNGEQLPIARRRKEEFLRALG